MAGGRAWPDQSRPAMCEIGGRAWPATEFGLASLQVQKAQENSGNGRQRNKNKYLRRRHAKFRRSAPRMPDLKPPIPTATAREFLWSCNMRLATAAGAPSRCWIPVLSAASCGIAGRGPLVVQNYIKTARARTAAGSARGGALVPWCLEGASNRSEIVYENGCQDLSCHCCCRGSKTDPGITNTST